MRIMIQSKLSRAVAQDGSAFTITAKFYDDTSDPWTLSAPTTIRYRIDEPLSGTQILDWTTISPASTTSFMVTGAQNTMQQSYRTYEMREVTIQANAGLSSQYNEIYRWRVNNLLGVA